MTSSIGGFFSGGSKSVSWKDAPIGTTVTGTITRVHEPEPQTDIKTGEPVVVKGRPKMQIRIELQTDLRDPSDPEDDGARTLYVKGWMQGAIGDALRRAGAQAPEVGGKLTVVHTELTPSDTPGFDPIKKFSADYVLPSAAATGQFFGSPAAAPAAAAPAAGSVAVAAPPAAPAPVRPSIISEAAWEAMDLATQVNVAKSVPPF